MFETLITLLIIALWLVSAAGVQTFSVRLTKSAQFRTQAVLLASEIGERMEANKSAATIGAYGLSGAAAAAPKDCTTALCTSTELAQWDLAEWSTRVAAALPNATATITAQSIANPISYTIVLSWDDRRGEQAYSTAATVERFTYTSVKTTFNPS